MPQRPQRPCRLKGCDKLHRNAIYCDDHAELAKVKSRGNAPRLAGRALQARRLAVWTRDPTCAMCGRLTDYPGGFELDHTVPLFKGGKDTEANCQVLCKGVNGCHHKKTAEDLGYEYRPPAGLDGYPIRAGVKE